MSGWRCFRMFRPSRTKASTCSPTAPWGRWPMRAPPPAGVRMAYGAPPAGLPADVKTKLITAFRAAIQDPRFKEFSKKNAFLVDDLTGDALTKEVDNVASALGTV